MKTDTLTKTSDAPTPDTNVSDADIRELLNELEGDGDFDPDAGADANDADDGDDGFGDADC